MNCQEFRKIWVHDTDEATLSHIELCDDCLAWIEANFDSDEEVRFMKEYPQPSAQLEDRIMKAIYEASIPGMPPLTAAAQPAALEQPAIGRRMPRRFQTWAWVSAAGFLLAVGALAMNGINGPNGGSDMALNGTANEAKSTPANDAGSNETLAFTPQTEAQGAAQPAQGSDKQDADKTAPTANQSTALVPESAKTNQTAPQQQIALGPNTPTTAQNTAGTAGGQQSLKKSEATGTTPAKEGTSLDRPLIPARNKNQPTSSPAAAKQQPPAAITALNDNAETAATAQPGDNAPNNVYGLAAADANDPAKTGAAMTAASEQTNETAQNGAASKAAIYPPMPAKQPITLSTFTDVATAVQASNLPVPTSAKLPAGFALHSVSLQYESETSKHVTQVSTEYKRNSDEIKIEVSRNEHGKRSLSIPGTFTATQLFTIDNEQAIGVSYDRQAASSTEQQSQHAVYFNTQKEGISLYVVIKGNGVRLEDLTDMAKQLSWDVKK